MVLLTKYTAIANWMIVPILVVCLLQVVEQIFAKSRTAAEFRVFGRRKLPLYLNVMILASQMSDSWVETLMAGRDPGLYSLTR